jgi:hypothetical protein
MGLLPKRLFRIEDGEHLMAPSAGDGGGGAGTPYRFGEGSFIASSMILEVSRLSVRDMIVE